MRFRQALFWDTDPKKIDPKKHAKYIIERILDFGNDGEVRWARRFYSPRLISSVVWNPRSLMPVSRNFWRSIYKCPKNQKIIPPWFENNFGVSGKIHHKRFFSNEAKKLMETLL